MAMKELSQYPPDKWIRAMNRKYPNIWTDLRKVYEDPGKMIRPNSGGIELLQSVPDWCIMPTFFPFLVMTDKYGIVAVEPCPQNLTFKTVKFS